MALGHKDPDVLQSLSWKDVPISEDFVCDPNLNGSVSACGGTGLSIREMTPSPCSSLFLGSLHI